MFNDFYKKIHRFYFYLGQNILLLISEELVDFFLKMATFGERRGLEGPVAFLNKFEKFSGYSFHKIQIGYLRVGGQKNFTNC